MPEFRVGFEGHLWHSFGLKKPTVPCAEGTGDHKLESSS